MDDHLASPAIAPGDLLAVLDHFDALLSRPLASLSDQIQRLDPATLGPPGDGCGDHVRTMLGLCDELSGLTREFAEYSALSGGLHIDDPVSTRLSHLAAEVDRRFARQAQARGVQWSAQVVGDDAEVTVEPTRFRQALALVIPHALNSARPGTPAHFEISRCDAGWQWTFSSPADVPCDDALERAYEPLARAVRAGQTDKPTNLAICRDLLGPVGGTLEVIEGPEARRCVTVRMDAEKVV